MQPKNYAVFLSAPVEMITSPEHVRQTLTCSQKRLNICGHNDSSFFFVNIHTTYFSTGCCYITPINLSNIPAVMATLNIYGYSWVELQKHCVYPQLSQQMTHLGFVGMLWQTVALRPDSSGCLCSFYAALLKTTGWKYETNGTATSYRAFAIIWDGDRNLNTILLPECLNNDIVKLFWEWLFVHSE